MLGLSAIFQGKKFAIPSQHRRQGAIFFRVFQSQPGGAIWGGSLRDLGFGDTWGGIRKCRQSKKSQKMAEEGKHSKHQWVTQK